MVALLSSIMVQKKSNQKSSKSGFTGVGCGILFGLPFAAVSVFMAWRLLSMLLLASAASNWIDTPATITHLELEQGDETQKIVGSYQYVYEGQRYTNDRIGLDTGSDNIGEYHWEFYRKLKTSFNANQPVTCYVNPSDPANSLLDRSLRPELVVFHFPFILCFGLAGFGIVIGAIVFYRHDKKRAARLKQFPDEPWKVREDWAAGEVASMRWQPLIVIGVFTMFWNSLAFPISIVFFYKEDVPAWCTVLIFAFPLIGLFMLGGFIYEATRIFRFGKSTLRLATKPGVVGGELSGVVVVPENLRPKGAYQVVLTCVEQQTRQRGSETETSSVALWEDTRWIEQTLSDKGGQHGVPIRFIIPSSAKPTDSENDDPVTWKLTVEAKVFGPDYKAEFEVPVFVTADSQTGIQATHERLTEFELKESLSQQLARENLIAEMPSKSELRISCPPMRHIGSAVVAVLAGALFAAVGIAFWWQGNGLDQHLFGAIFSFAGVVVILCAVGVLLSSSELNIDGKRWRLKSGWYGFRGAGREFSADNIKDIGLKKSMFSSSGNNLKQRNCVTARLTDGTKLKLVRGLSNRRTERRLIFELQQLAGLPLVNKDVDAAEE